MRYGGFDFDTAESLRRVVEAVRGLDPPPAFAVLGGDLVSPDLLDPSRMLAANEYEPSYALLAEILGGLPCPVHPLVGNHDHRVTFNRAFRRRPPEPDAPCYYSVTGRPSAASTLRPRRARRGRRRRARR